MTGMIDTHAHFDDKAYDEDRILLLEELNKNGIDKVVNISASIETAKKTIVLTKEYEFVYGVLGVHPSETQELNEESFAWLKNQLLLPKIVAVGEIGLDYYWDTPERELQEYWFIRQLDMAIQYELPVVIHSRDAAEDTLRIMKDARRKADEKGKAFTGVIHCFSYSREMAEEYVKMGFYLGIGGVVTFKNSRKLKEVVVEIPLEALVLETDCPYLAPEPFRGQRNHSGNLSYVVAEIARLRDCTEEDVIRATSENAAKLYPKLH